MERSRDPVFFKLMADSFARLLGDELVPGEMTAEAAARWLYEDAPFAVLAHSPEDDPRFIYGNLVAQKRFEYSWDELVRLPSRLSAEKQDRLKRQDLMDSVRRIGYLRGYQGLRISKSGRRFMIEDVTLWRLVDVDGLVKGEAARISRTTDL
ncbi:MAG TPA: MEKHLA domain-containing protein [Trinickia sp.]|jgi:hypothetical protein|uniref:MEKHLA domain-containing protein n=1 Tax=Trinickia sp. TaxID=2571163 RepID=UPI002B76C4C3|nr:MEKHLA domain-containing protein [Trinickia sp.]HTI17692.1 MEKHLA domain-containing protein [Trinickia sp.]